MGSKGATTTTLFISGRVRGTSRIVLWHSYDQVCRSGDVYTLTAWSCRNPQVPKGLYSPGQSYGGSSPRSSVQLVYPIPYLFTDVVYQYGNCKDCGWSDNTRNNVIVHAGAASVWLGYPKRMFNRFPRNPLTAHQHIILCAFQTIINAPNPSPFRHQLPTPICTCPKSWRRRRRTTRATWLRHPAGYCGTGYLPIVQSLGRPLHNHTIVDVH